MRLKACPSRSTYGSLQPLQGPFSSSCTLCFIFYCCFFHELSSLYINMYKMQMPPLLHTSCLPLQICFAPSSVPLEVHVCCLWIWVHLSNGGSGRRSEGIWEDKLKDLFP